MKKRPMSILLVLGMVLGALLPTAQAEDRTDPPAPLFEMRVTADVEGELKEGDQFSVTVCGAPLQSETEQMASFQFRLDYPADQLELVSLEPKAAGGCFEKNLTTGVAAYSVTGADGVELKKGGTPLAVATFAVGKLTGDSVTVGVTRADAEITRPQDSVSLPITVHGAEILRRPVVQIDSAAAGQVTVQLNNNPAGKLIAAVYDGQGRMLRCAVQDKVSEKAGAVTVKLNHTGGSFVEAFLVNGAGAPLCAADRMNLA